MFDQRLAGHSLWRHAVLLLAIAGMLFAVDARAADERQNFLRLGLARELAGALQPRVDELVEIVQSTSRGQIRIELAAVESGRDLLQRARRGELDIAILPNAEMAAISPEFEALELPFLFDGRDHAARVLDGQVGRELLARLERVRLRGLGFWDLAEIHISSANRPIRSSNDLRGLRLGLSARSEYLPRVMEALETKPVAVPSVERFQALQTGAIEATEVSLGEFLGRRYYEVQGTLSLTRHRYLAAPVVMNWVRFDRLDERQREAIEAAVREIGERLRHRHEADERAALARIREHGVEVIQDPDMRHARDIAWKVAYWEYAKRSGFDVIDVIEQQR